MLDMSLIVIDFYMPWIVGANKTHIGFSSAEAYCRIITQYSTADMPEKLC